MGLFLDIHTPKYKDHREVLWDMAEAMNQELRALRDAGCRCIQIEEPTLHFWANTFGRDHEEVHDLVIAEGPRPGVRPAGCVDEGPEAVEHAAAHACQDGHDSEDQTEDK